MAKIIIRLLVAFAPAAAFQSHSFHFQRAFFPLSASVEKDAQRVQLAPASADFGTLDVAKPEQVR